LAAYEGLETQLRADVLDQEPMARRNLWKDNKVLPRANTLFRFVGDASRVVDFSDLGGLGSIASWIGDTSIARLANAAHTTAL
jgi:hypothetical protein